MATIRDDAPTQERVRFWITPAGLRALGRDVPAGLRDDQPVSDVFLRAIAERSGVAS